MGACSTLSKGYKTFLVILSSGPLISCYIIQALYMNNLSMVLFVCSRVDAQQLFSRTPCVFPQNVLLALIQQLSADLGSATELKLE